MKFSDNHSDMDKLFIDEEDKKKVMALPELQREKILHERYTKIQDTQLLDVIKDLGDKQADLKESKKTLKFEDCDFVLPRSLIVENIFKPFIGIVKGCFVKAVINKVPVICKIMGIRKVEPYALLSKTPQMCSIGFDVDSGKKVLQGLQVNFFSSSRVMYDEFDSFIASFEIESIDNIRKKYQHVCKEFSRGLTDSELTKTIENRLKDNPKKQTNTEKKIEIIAKRDEAMQNKDKEKALFYQKQLESIEDQEREERNAKMQDEIERKKRRTKDSS